MENTIVRAQYTLSQLDGYLHLFHNLASLNNSVMINVSAECISLLHAGFGSCGYIPRNGMAAAYGNVLEFLFTCVCLCMCRHM